MDGWSPGYLGSVAYNHNGMMRMYETQSGVDAPAGRGGGGRGAGVDTAATALGRGAAAAPIEFGRGGGGGGGGRATVPTGRGGGQPREWYRGIPIPPGAATTFSRRNNTNYMQTGLLSALQLTSM